MTAPPTVRCDAVTSTAPGAATNEDAHLAAPELGLFVVADGISGRPAGDLASRAAVDALGAAVLGGRGGEGRGLLHAALMAANAEVLRRAGGSPRTEGACAAVTAALVGPGGATFVHVGDCRAYRYRAGAITQLTTDHVELRDGRRFITRVVGRDPMREPDVLEVPLAAGDVLLLCTDGLTKVVDDHAIAGVLADAPSPTEACLRLVDAARAAGTTDDTTVVVVAV